MRTYEEAVKLMVEWWMERMFMPLNQCTGNDKIFIPLNNIAINAQDRTTAAEKTLFKNKLTQLLLAINSGKHNTMLKVDYDPNPILKEACTFSNVSRLCLPKKTFTFINEDNEIEGIFGYGSEWFKI